MLRIAASALAALLATSAAMAQSIGEPLPGRSTAKDKLKPARSDTAARACPEYGPGFVRVEGSSLCVRAGGAVRVDFGKSSRSGYNSSGYGSSVGALVDLEARGESSLGPVRSVVRMRGQSDRGLESGPFRY
ncbi:porin [Bosea lathyri]|uniref:Porin n=1 Tax=Bosea lathyri TaxID=1036778 RepID=A0A1H6BTR1_9HYPH|nr:porin [Bosea lathyri]SEG64022.1 Porin subfamily protein [Bosea lathyri]